jgi:prepilin-type processing-associated H-X9-DG protein
MSFIINKDEKEISSRHRGVAIVSFCDGHSECLSDSIPPHILKALLTVDGGENLENAAY